MQVIYHQEACPLWRYFVPSWSLCQLRPILRRSKRMWSSTTLLRLRLSEATRDNAQCGAGRRLRRLHSHGGLGLLLSGLGRLLQASLSPIRSWK